MLRPPARTGLRPCLLSLARWRRISTEAASHPSNKVQVYLSRSHDPFVNLSVEHHLFQVTPPDSTVLTLYTDAPSIVIGRNQNPWLEIDLSRLAQADEPVHLVRRRSGGGTVFHDLGNVNFSVICPTGAFDRDKHGEMVVRALRALGRPNTRVNGRHDIVMDDEGRTFKVSGSAFKLSRLRSLHHGTCLLGSDLAAISGLLRSPAEGFIKAQGVDSVRSAVRNINADPGDFQGAVVEEFAKMHGHVQLKEEFGDDALEMEGVARGYEELRSRGWLYGQTPRFTFSTCATEQDPRPRASLPFTVDVAFKAKHGVFEGFSIRRKGFDRELDGAVLLGQSLHDVQDWGGLLGQLNLEDGKEVGEWMNQVLGTEFTSKGER